MRDPSEHEAELDPSAATRQLGAVLDDLLAEPPYSAGLARADRLARFGRVLAEVCGLYAADCIPISIISGQALVLVPNTTVLQFAAMNEAAVLARLRRDDSAMTIESINFRLARPPDRAGGRHGN